MTFSKLIKQKRIKKGLSLRDLEAICNISNSYLCQLETGKRGVPKLGILLALSKSLNINMTTLIKAAIEQFEANK